MVYIVLPPELSRRSIQTLVQYMYSGEATVSNDILNEVLRGGEMLKIRGLWRNNPSGEPPNAIPLSQQPDAPSVSLPLPPSQTSSVISNASTPSTKHAAGDLVYPQSSLASVSCSLNTGPPPPSVAKASPRIVMSPRHASHPPPPSNSHHNQNGGIRSSGPNQIKRELDYPVNDQPSPPPHHQSSKSMYIVRKMSGASSGDEIMGSGSRCKPPMVQMEYVQENGRERRYLDERHHHEQNRRTSMENHQQAHHHSHPSTSQQPTPARLIVRDSEVLRMSASGCPPETMNERRSSVPQIDSHPQQQQQHIHHQHQLQQQQQPIEYHHMDQADDPLAIDRIMPIVQSSSHPSGGHSRVLKVTSTTMPSASIGGQHPIRIRGQLRRAEPMGYLTIKQEPLEWCELSSTAQSGVAEILPDTQAHIEATVKPELVYPENEDSCDVTDG